MFADITLVSIEYMHYFEEEKLTHCMPHKFRLTDRADTRFYQYFKWRSSFMHTWEPSNGTETENSHFIILGIGFVLLTQKMVPIIFNLVYRVTFYLVGVHIYRWLRNSCFVLGTVKLYLESQSVLITDLVCPRIMQNVLW